MFVTDRKTGKVYNPETEMNRIFTLKWFITQLKRMKYQF